MAKRKKEPLSFDDNCTATPSEMSTILSSCLYFYCKEPVKTDDEAQNRIIEYFTFCIDNDSKPTWEELCMALGVSRQTVNKWLHKQLLPNSARSDIIQKAKQMMESFDAKLVAEGKLNPILYMFRTKVHYGYDDNPDHHVSTETSQLETTSMREIAKSVGIDLLEE